MDYNSNERKDILGNLMTDIYESASNNDKTIEQLEWFKNIKKKKLNLLINNPAKYFLPQLEDIMNKFELMVNLGEFKVPRDYERGEYYYSISDIDLENLYFNGSLLTSENIPWPSAELRKGASVNIKLYKQLPGTITTSDERMMFLLAKSTMFLGMQGLLFLSEFKKSYLEKNLEYTSFEILSSSLKDSNNKRVVASLSLGEDDDEEVMTYFPYQETEWNEDSILVCFNQDY